MAAGVWRDLLLRGGDIAHLHYASPAHTLIAAPPLFLRRRRRVATFHSVRVLKDLESLPPPLRNLLRATLNRFDLFVCVREEIADELRGAGFLGPDYHVMPAFLPPSAAEAAPTRLTTELALQLNAAVGLRLAAAAYYLGHGYGKDDVYGVEFLVELLLERPSDGVPVELFVLVSHPPTTEDQRNAALKLVERTSGTDSLKLHIQYGAALVPVLAVCDAFLRPSREDGDSVAVREALSLGVPVLASDVVRRPPGTAIMPLADRAAAAAAISAFLENLSRRDGHATVIPPEMASDVDAFLDALAGISDAPRP